MVPSSERFYKSYGFPYDTSQAGALQLLPHFYIYLSYIYSGDENIKWQNNLLVNYTAGTPIYIAYDLRCHIYNKMIIGLSASLNDDISIETGVIVHNNLEICYSYDYITSKVGYYTSGSHEITLVYNFDKKGHAGDRKEQDNGFRRRKYGYMF